jgi:hypothetical protein
VAKSPFDQAASGAMMITNIAVSASMAEDGGDHRAESV